MRQAKVRERKGLHTAAMLQYDVMCKCCDMRMMRSGMICQQYLLLVQIKLIPLMQQMRQPKQSNKMKQIRYRKLTLAGGNTIVTYSSAGKTHPKGVIIEFPIIDNNSHEDNNKNPLQPPLDPKIYEDELYRKNNYRAVKALMKVYDDSHKKKSADSMNMLGLDIKKIHYEPPQNKHSLNKINKILTHNQSLNTRSSHHRHYSPFTYIATTEEIKHKNASSEVMARPGFTTGYKKANSNYSARSRSRENREQSVGSMQEKDLETNRSSMYGNEEDREEERLEMSESAFLARKKKIHEVDKCKNGKAYNSQNRSQKEELEDDSSNKTHINFKSSSSRSINADNSFSPPHKLKTHKKHQKYLYEKLAGQEKVQREEVNLVYDRRIRTYTDFIWKLQLSHNVIISHLDLRPEEIGVKGRRMKYFVGPGNNSAMIRGLLKRRYWWVPSEEKGECCFIWTQIKVNQVFDKQKKGRTVMAGFPKLKQKGYKIEEQNEQKELIEQKSKVLRRESLSPTKNNGSKTLTIFQSNESFNNKILNEQDLRLYQKYYAKHEQVLESKESGPTCRNYQYKYEKIQKELKELKVIEYEDNIIHNHLENNFYLGNKKALFYNMKEYYQLMGENVFEYLPLTFHIKKGMKDLEYKRFIAYYNKRKAIIKKEEKIEEEQGCLEKRKTRNIWIVKPGENTNQGRGITVIDEIYELNNIIKRVGEKRGGGSPKKGSKEEEEESESKRTYIVQMYLDRPLLYNNRKFDIRHYMLITNMYGVMRAYWYTDGYIRTSSYEFNINNFEPEVHLTNDAIQKKYPDYGRYEAYNKLSYEEFQRYLDTAYPTKKYNFKEQILIKMKKMGTDAAKSVYTKISPRNLLNNFEIFGLDFMIDKNFKPWLIEINTNPCLDCSCPLLDRIIPYVVEQSFKLSLDVMYPPPSHYPNTAKHFAPLVNMENFKYELIFDSQVEGQLLNSLYKKTKGNLIDEIGDVSDDEQFKDDGKEIKLDDFT